MFYINSYRGKSYSEGVQGKYRGSGKKQIKIIIIF